MLSRKEETHLLFSPLPHFMHKMNLETTRLNLRPFQKSDVDHAFAVLGDAGTMLFYPSPYSKEQVGTIIRRNIESFETHGYGLFAVLETDTGAFVGDCGITVQNIDGQVEFEIGYRIRKDRWGLGYAPEAAEAIKSYGFQHLRMKKLCSYMPSDHIQSRRVAEKIGMQLEKEYQNPRNRGIFTSVYSIHNPHLPIEREEN